MNGHDFIIVDTGSPLSRLTLRDGIDPELTAKAAPFGWRPIISSNDPVRWAALPAAEVRPDPHIANFTPAFDSIQSSKVKSAISEFQLWPGASPCDLRLSRDTGLPSFMFGDLHPEYPPGDNLKTAADFIQKNPLLIAGRDSLVVAVEEQPSGAAGIHLRLTRRTTWADHSDQIRFQQFSPAGIRIYGAQIVTTFDADGKLTIMSSSLYPEVENLPTQPPPVDLKAMLPACESALKEQLPQNIKFGQLITDGAYSEPSVWIYPRLIYSKASGDPQEYVAILASAWEHDNAIGMWRFNLDKWVKRTGSRRPGVYVPVMKVWFEDQYHSLWHAILDITAPEQPTLIDFDLEERTFAYLLFPASATTRTYFSQIDQPNVNAQALVTNLGLEQILDFGHGTSFADADGVKFEGHVDPEHTQPSPDLTQPDRFRAATVFYHLRKAQAVFKTFLDQATIDAPNTAAPNPLNEIKVIFDDPDRTTEYRDGKIYIGRGFDTGAGAVEDPGLDPEVIVHEFAHAVAHFYFNDLFSQVCSDQLVQQVIDGLNEALAFYLSSVVFGDAQWAEYAYADWAPERNLNSAAQVFDQNGWNSMRSDPFSTAHGMGVWLGRLFWKIQGMQNPVTDRSMNYLLFKTLGALAGLGLSASETEGTTLERLIDTLNLIAKAICAQCDSPTQRSSIEQDVFGLVGLKVS